MTNGLKGEKVPEEVHGEDLGEGDIILKLFTLLFLEKLPVPGRCL